MSLNWASVEVATSDGADRTILRADRLLMTQLTLVGTPSSFSGNLVTILRPELPCHFRELGVFRVKFLGVMVPLPRLHNKSIRQRAQKRCDRHDLGSGRISQRKAGGKANDRWGDKVVC